jgi:glycine dehydrogenase subunit 2
VVLSQALAPFAPAPWVVHDDSGYALIEREEGDAAQAFGRLCAFQGQMGMYVRALSYMMSHGADGLRQVAEDAVLNANYIKARLSDLMSAAFPDGPCMHEALFDDEWLKGTDITTLDFAKAMIDEGFHPMTMYFPLVVHGAMLIEPTETESKEELDAFVAAMVAIREEAQTDPAKLTGAPYTLPVRRLDDVRAAKQLDIAWRAA